MGSILQQPVAIPPGSGKVLKYLGVTHKLTSVQTGGAFYLCEAEFAPESGSPLHIHHYEDEVIHVLEGAIDIRLDKEKLHAPAGGIVHLPKNIPHALQNPLKNPCESWFMRSQAGWKITLTRWKLPYKTVLLITKFMPKYP
jgi:quercetin dioxygenase-like cupin family protein